MTPITAEAVTAMCDVTYRGKQASRSHAVLMLEAALPHLTDDGVALPVRRDGEGALAAAPSSPRPMADIVKVTEVLAAHCPERQPLSDWNGCTTRECDDAMDTPEEIATHQAAALVAAGVFGEGATPAIDREAIAQAVAGHTRSEMYRGAEAEWWCPCGKWRTHDINEAVYGHARHVADLVLALGGG
jgi:hypothetical protein